MEKRFDSVKENGLLFVLEHFVDAWKWVFIVVIGALLLYTPKFSFMTPANMRIVIMIILYAMLGMGLNVLIGYTVWPDASLVEMTIVPRNPTEVTNSFLFWTYGNKG